MRTYHSGKWDGESVFVFGSNLVGRHGLGASKFALEHAGAQYGKGYGPQGNSYALPTIGRDLQVLPLDSVNRHVEFFIAYAKLFGDTAFFVTAIGTGLAGYEHSQIAPMFKDAPDNCILPQEWRPFLDTPSDEE